jgi:hypothetical protein
MRCPYCHCDFQSELNYKRHVKYCYKTPKECEHCQESVPGHKHWTDHGDNCDLRPIQCNFCRNPFIYRTIGKHLSVCDELNKLLMKHNVECNTEKYTYFQTVIKQLLIKRKARYFRDYLISIYLDEPLIMKMLYCVSHFPEVMTTSQLAIEIWQYFPQRMLSDIKFIMGKEFTCSFMISFCDELKLNYKATTESFYISDKEWDLMLVEVGELNWQFVANKERAEKYRNSALEVLGKYMNVYVSRMIMDYYFVL